jgi:membrane-associated phospholipid phosphatase
MLRYFKKGIRSFWEKVTLLSIEVLLVLFAFFASLGAFIFIARMIFLEKREVFDQKVFSVLENQVSNINTGIMQIFSFLGSHYFLIPANILLSGWFLFVKKQTWFSIKIPVISLSSLVLMFALKQFFHRERPLVPLLQEAKGLSFPSGHALMSFAFYGLLIYMCWEGYENKLVRIALVTILLLTIFFIGLSRIYLRVHFASDVIAGFCLGLIWLIFSLLILNKIEAMSKKPVID